MNRFQRVMQSMFRGDALNQVDDVSEAGHTLLSMGGSDSASPIALSGASGSASSAQGGSRWWNPRPCDARSDTVPHLSAERGKSRELARTSPIACGAINTNIDRVVGTGLALSAQPSRAILGWSIEDVSDWKRRIQAEFSLWADSAECDLAQTLNFYELQSLILRSTLESGDCFTLLPDGQRTHTQPYALRIQILEADRIGNPFAQMDAESMSGGVHFGANGAPVAYHVYDRHPAKPRH
jgi:capsid protein